MSSVKYYRELLTQDQRIEAFRRAIHRAVRPGDRVLDIGAGLGTFAFFAADAGAGEVWAVDGDPIIHVARTVARLNRLAERIRFERGWIPDVELPGPAQVVVFEDFSPRLVDQRFFRLHTAVRSRYAAAGARFVPEGATVRAAPVGGPELLAAAGAWPDGETRYGIDWSATREYVMNSPVTNAVRSEALAADPVVVARVSFDRELVVEPPTPVQWISTRSGPVHGLAYWFDLEFGAGEVLSNRPGGVPASWGHLYLPIDPPLPVTSGDVLEGWAGPERLQLGLPGWLSWGLRAGGRERRGHEFCGAPASVTDLLGASPGSVPRLTSVGRRTAEILRLADGSTTLADIADRLVERNPGMTRAEALHLAFDALRGKIESGGAPQ
jgi:protein arginine N-methyltransferase 1